MTLAASNQAVVQEATTALTTAITGSGEFASWIGFLSFQQDGDLQKALNIVEAIEQGNYTLNDLFIAAQSKTEAGVPTDITGEPNPTIQVLGNVFEIGSLLGETKVETWLTTNGKTSTYHSREFFTSVGDDAPVSFDPNWDEPDANQAPVLTADAPSNGLVEAGESQVHEVINGFDTATVLLHRSDPDGDTTTYNLTDWSNEGGGLYSKDGTYGTATLDTATNQITYNLHNDWDATNILTNNQAATDKFTLSINDGDLNSAPVDITFNITGTGDWFEDTVTQELTKTNVGSEQVLEFSLAVQEDAFNFSGTVTLTAQGDMDAKNEHGVVVDGGDLIDLLKLTGELNSNVALEPADVTVSGWTDVAAGGFEDGAVAFDVTVSGPVGAGTTIEAILTYDYWM